MKNPFKKAIKEFNSWPYFALAIYWITIGTLDIAKWYNPVDVIIGTWFIFIMFVLVDGYIKVNKIPVWRELLIWIWLATLLFLYIVFGSWTILK